VQKVRGSLELKAAQKYMRGEKVTYNKKFPGLFHVPRDKVKK